MVFEKIMIPFKNSGLFTCFSVAIYSGPLVGGFSFEFESGNNSYFLYFFGFCLTHNNLNTASLMQLIFLKSCY